MVRKSITSCNSGLVAQLKCPCCGHRTKEPSGTRRASDRPAQVVVREHGAELTISVSSKLRGRVYILEDYDMRIAQFLVRGVDV